MDYLKDSGILKALGHPVRLQIVAGLLNKNECNVNTMVSRLNVPQSTVSQHLGVLKSRGIISANKKGVETCYFIADERVREILKILK
jgi:DNA-binding transcriptional ArsR family regulator